MRLPFPVLSDSGLRYASQLGIDFELPEDLQRIYAEFGIDLPTLHGDAGWRLPIPTRLVVARDATVRAVDADPDYTRRPEPEASLAVLRELPPV